MLKSFRVIIILLFVFAVQGCPGDRAGMDVIFVSIAIAPSDSSIALGNAQQFTAIGTGEDGSVYDLTHAVIWSSSDISVAIISNDTTSIGIATAVGIGYSTVSASRSGITGTTSLTVRN